MFRMKMNMNILGAVAISVLAMATSVSAATIKVNWSASIVDNDGVAGVANGDTITGMFTYNDTVPDSGTGSFGVYETNHVSSFTLNGLSGSTSGNSMKMTKQNRPTTATARATAHSTMATVGSTCSVCGSKIFSSFQ